MTAIIHIVAAARPNFMKVAPLWHVLKEASWCRPLLIHTGQHYDANMSDAFTQDLGLPEPAHYLGVGSGTHAEQTANVMVPYEKLCMAERPAWTVVVGDVNSTLACALAGSKLNIPVAHLEAGLRSRDRTMPEEINRIVTDAVSDLLWTPSPDADENLRGEGVPEKRIERVGNIMIDSYELLRPRIEMAEGPKALGLAPRSYGVVTLHRPANVDNEANLKILVEALRETAVTLPLIFPCHPRTRQRLAAFGLLPQLEGHNAIHLIEPLGYIAFMSLVRQARLVVTDSGGVQEETTYLDIPCITVRTTTERPITLTEGTNRLAAADEIALLAKRAIDGQWPRGRKPDLWDGKAALRVADSLKRQLDHAA